MRKVLDTAALGFAGLLLGLVANALPALAASSARLEFSKAQLALALSAGLWTRALSSTVAGALIDRFGGRRTLRDASVGAAAAGLGLGFLFLTGSGGKMFVAASVLHAAACYFLAFPGPAMSRINAERLDASERGRHAGLYGALAFPAELIALPIGLWLGTRVPPSAFVFFPAAAALLALPAVLGLRPDAPESESRLTLADLRALAFRGQVIMLAALEACAGAVRWGLLGWSTHFLIEVHNIRPGGPRFGLALASLAAGAVLGPVLCGILSDRVFGGRRAPAALTLFAAQAGALIALGRALEPVAAVVFLGTACGAAFGVHALLAGASAMDIGGRRSAGALSGILIGVHHAAGGLAVLLVGTLINRGGWGAWTMTLLPFSVVGAAAALALFVFKTEAPDPAP